MGNFSYRAALMDARSLELTTGDRQFFKEFCSHKQNSKHSDMCGFVAH